jgi:hypothetical protein
MLPMLRSCARHRVFHLSAGKRCRRSGSIVNAGKFEGVNIVPKVLGSHTYQHDFGSEKKEARQDIGEPF